MVGSTPAVLVGIEGDGAGSGGRPRGRDNAGTEGTREEDEEEDEEEEDGNDDGGGGAATERGRGGDSTLTATGEEVRAVAAA